MFTIQHNIHLMIWPDIITVRKQKPLRDDYRLAVYCSAYTLVVLYDHHHGKKERNSQIHLHTSGWLFLNWHISVL